VTPLPTVPVLFKKLEFDTGSAAGARAVFQTMITDIVAVKHPTANEVAGPGGSDWGIDTYVGRLDHNIAVWQSKFFLDWKGEDQRKQVRESFNQLMKKATEEGLTVRAWTLCIPCDLPPDEQKWFDGWKSRTIRKHKVLIELWNGTGLRRLLMQPDAAAVRREYFEAGPIPAPSPPVATPTDIRSFDEALFVRQLEAAGHLETDAARGMFFAAEALVRAMAANEDKVGTAGLEEVHLEVQGLWEQRFNAAVPGADADGRMPGLVNSVLDAAANCPDPDGLRLRPAHRRGIAHRLVEDTRAGWVTHWRDIAASHQGPPAAEAVAAQLQPSTT
jgi:hypothetical protein